MATKKELQIKSLLKLKKHIAQKEKELFPNAYSYISFSVNDEPYIQFTSNMAYPIEIVEKFVKDAKKVKVEDGYKTVGLILQLTNDITPKDKKSCSQSLITSEKVKKNTKKTKIKQKKKENATKRT